MSPSYKRFFALLTLFGGLLSCAPRAAADIILISDWTVAQVNSRSFGLDDDSIADSGTGATAIASVTGITSTTTSLFSNSVFSGDFGHARTGGNDDFAFGLVRTIFSVTTPTTYTISGSYTNSSSTTGLEVGLRYEVSGAHLFHHFQQSSFGTTLTPGVSNGHDLGPIQGSLTGLLLPGSDYRFFAQPYSKAPFNGDGGATADGLLLLDFQSAVPEPGSTTLLIGSCLIVFARFRTSRRRKKS
jgi:hypothetical protein